MGRLRVVAFVAAAWAVCMSAPPSGAQDAPPAPPPQVVKSADGTSSITLPGTWKVVPAKAAPAKDCIQFDVVTPTNESLFFDVADRTTAEVSEIACAASHAAWLRENNPAADVKISATPFPSVVITRHEEGKAWTRVYRFTLAGRTIRRAECSVKAEAADGLMPAIRDALASCSSAPRDPLPPPAGYVRSTKPGIEWWSAPAVKSADIAKAQAVVASAFAASEKRYGALRVAGTVSPRVFLHASRAACAAVTETYTDPETQFSASVPAATIHLYPFDDKDARACATATRISVHVAVACTFGAPRPTWFSFASEALSFSEVLVGKPHPHFPVSLQQLDRPGELETLAALAAMDAQRVLSSRQIDGIAYLLVLREGPKEYKAALRSFLDVLAKTGDPEAAMKPLLALDQAKLAADARKHFDEKTK